MIGADLHLVDQGKNRFNDVEGVLRGWLGLEFEVDVPIQFQGQLEGFAKRGDVRSRVSGKFDGVNGTFCDLSERIVSFEPGPSIERSDLGQGVRGEGCRNAVGVPVGDIGRSHHRIVVHQHQLMVGGDGDVGLPHIGAERVCLASSDEGVLRREAPSTSVSDDDGHTAVSASPNPYEEVTSWEWALLDSFERQRARNLGCPTITHRTETVVNLDSEDEDSGDQTIDGLSPEDLSLRQSRRALIFGLLTPVWWVFMLILINLLAGLFPSTSPDSTFVFITWSVMALIFTVTVTYTGVQQGRLIRGYEEQKGLWFARGAVVIGALFTLASLAITIAIFTSGDASTRPTL